MIEPLRNITMSPKQVSLSARRWINAGIKGNLYVMLTKNNASINLDQSYGIC